MNGSALLMLCNFGLREGDLLFLLQRQVQIQIVVQHQIGIWHAFLGIVLLFVLGCLSLDRLLFAG